MTKPRVIIVDTDEYYIASIQSKFAKDFFDLIDIEIITNQQYFNELFSKPQKAEILIVSEQLYNGLLQRHNISNIFIMMEHGEEQSEDSNVVKLSKYTSVKEIFNEIINKSAKELKIQQTQHGTQIIVITSASGGVGKTTVAMGMSACLTKNFKKVLYVNACRLPAFQYMLDNQSAIKAPDVYSNLLNPSDSVYLDIKHLIRNEIFSYMPPFKAALMSIGLDFSVYEKIVLSAKRSGEYDYIVVDVENTFDENLTRFLDLADKVIIVLNQTNKSVNYTNQFVSNVNGINGEKYVFICNDFRQEEDNILIRPDTILKFSINDYIEHINNYESKRVIDFTNESGIQRCAFLVL